MSDQVSNPAHYTQGGIQVVDFIQAKGLNYCRGNVIKYICRAGIKNPEKEIEDLEKARQYIEFELARLRAIAEDQKAAGVKTGAGQ